MLSPEKGKNVELGEHGPAKTPIEFSLKYSYGYCTTNVLHIYVLLKSRKCLITGQPRSLKCKLIANEILTQWLQVAALKDDNMTAGVS